MGTWQRLAATALLGLTACGGGGGGGGDASAGSGGYAGSAFGVVQLISHAPTEGAVQVPLDVTIELQFDANIVAESFDYPDTWLRETATQTDVPFDVQAAANGQVTVRPINDLAAETEYTFQLAALTTDVSGRILDRTVSFAFRTLDVTPPSLLGVDVPHNAIAVSRSAPITITFDEPIEPTSISDQSLYLRDDFGSRFACQADAVDRDVILTPTADLPGDREVFVVVTEMLTDRAGNRLQTPLQSAFTTASDRDGPSATGCWPLINQQDVSPLCQPTFDFSESMDPATVATTSLLFQDDSGHSVPFDVDATPDQRRLRILPRTPLLPNRSYTVAFTLGSDAATDVSGNALVSAVALVFTTGTDQSAPQLVASTPAHGQDRVPGVLVAELDFDEPLAPDWINSDTVQLVAGDEEWETVVELVGDRTLRATPILRLPVDTQCSLQVRGGQDGLRDLAGNVAADIKLTFTTSSDSETPEALLLPPDAATEVAVSSRLSVTFDAPMDPATLNSSTVLFTDDDGTPLTGMLSVTGGDRVVTFTPDSALASDSYYRVRIIGGNAGPRRKSGNWFDADRESRFRTGSLVDLIPPTLSVSINDLPANRRDGIVLPPFGWTVEIDASDAQSQWPDVGAVEVQLSGGVGPRSDTWIAAAEIAYGSARFEVPESAALTPGAWTMIVRAPDLSGNIGQSDPIDFQVDATTGGAMPFERTQIVWVRTELDRDGNGRRDFTDDMIRLGFATEGDPNGTNDWLEQLGLDGILAKVNRLYERSARGEPVDAGSVSIRFTTYEPIALPHMQMALGGMDPEGDWSRGVGDPSTGVLGRAFYDYRNGNVAERNTSSSPGTGVFPAEMFLYQARIHLQVYPSFQTVFASKFLPICPGLGGTPAGADPLDAAVLQPNFDYENATNSQRVRWNTVMLAMDDWASVIGVILAHEVGHSVGLVAPGDMPTGLLGDASLHNTFAGAAEVMAPSVGYEAMATMDYGFRDVDLAYLRQRILLR